MTKDKEVDNILDGLSGDLRIGEKYYIFGITLHVIGTVTKVTDEHLVLDNTTIVMNAGSDDDAVSKILAGKVKPANCEQPQRKIFFRRAAIVMSIPFKP